MRNASWMIGILLAAAGAGCTQRSSPLLANDKALRRPSVELAAESVKRFPFKADAPRGGEAVARAQVGYSLNVLEIANRSDENWTNVEIWVNKSYVVFLPAFEPGKLKRIPFSAIFNDAGQHFPLNNRNDLIKVVELYRDGKMYDVPLQLAD